MWPPPSVQSEVPCWNRAFWPPLHPFLTLLNVVLRTAKRKSTASLTNRWGNRRVSNRRTRWIPEGSPRPREPAIPAVVWSRLFLLSGSARIRSRAPAESAYQGLFHIASSFPSHLNGDLFVLLVSSREAAEVDEITKGCPLDMDDESVDESSTYDMLYQPGAKIKFSGHRNTRQGS